MSWINVNYNSDQTYIVQENAIQDTINNVLKIIKKIKLINKPQIKINENHTNLEVCLDIKLPKKDQDNPFELLKQLTNQLESAIKNLIDAKPNNIQLNILDFY
ncbi:MMB_0454 family protein [Mycoplasmopsis gallopavonis]|uniref:Uncharacterized protein n=1 Tax=Mycoplasmopsis gallopavonis TaxID=76629 RepID=A0A449AZG0_9BACT|nr:hypothetical protein [Mycoplasmopsis gallopavonis]RIV16357.1 hypothetical protein D1113_02700 [Mycoplasmopsis gallopavonis]VEU72874.1 Uncharacterised protein [Mycoplasmopsis gallopavonis]